MTVHNHTTTTQRPIKLLPASLLRLRPVLHQRARVRMPEVLILCPAGQTDIGVILRRIAQTFRARGRRVALWQVSRPGGSRPRSIETAGKQDTRRGGRNYRDMGGTIHIRKDNKDIRY